MSTPTATTTTTTTATTTTSTENTKPALPDVSWRAEELAATSSLETASCFKIDGVPYVRYFAIGSMINPTSLRYRGITPISSQPAILRGYRLVFQGAGGMASIMPDPNAHFHGVLHTITAKQMAELDKIESVYGRMDVPLELYDGCTIIGSVYKFDPTKFTFNTHNPPSERYIDIITRGCVHYGVHQNHIDWLKNHPHVPRKKIEDMLTVPEPPPGVTITKKELAQMDGIDGRPLAWAVNGKCMRVRPNVDPETAPNVKQTLQRLTQFHLAGKEVTQFYSRMLYEPLFPEASSYEDMHPDHKRMMEDVYATWSSNVMQFMEVFARLVPDPDSNTDTTTTESTPVPTPITNGTITPTTNGTTHTKLTPPETPITSSPSPPPVGTGSTFLIDGVPHVRYFAIGSMLNPTSMRYRDISPVSSVPGILYGYRLVFAGMAGMASIVEDAEAHFHGVVHVLTQEHMTRLDQLESAYARSDVEIVLYDGSRVIAGVYQMDPALLIKGVESTPPAERYIDIMIQGCKYYGVKQSHIDWLQQQKSTPRPQAHELKLLPEPPEGEFVTQEELCLMNGCDRPVAWSINGKILQVVTPVEELPGSLQWLIKRMQADFAGKEYIHWLSKIIYDPKYPECSCWADMDPMHRLQLEHHVAKHILAHPQHFKVAARLQGTQHAHHILNGHTNGTINP